MIPKKSLFALANVLGGLPILGSLSGTPAARVGLRYGDVLLSVNGKPTPNVEDYIEAKALRADGMDVTFFRDGAERSASLLYETAVNTNPAAILSELMSMRIEPVEDPTGKDRSGLS